MATKKEILLDSLKINKLTKQQFNQAKEVGEISENEIYISGEILDDGDMLKSEYDSVFAGKELSLNGDKVLLDNPDKNRISSVTIKGFTIQSGDGEPSPNNVREIKNVGICNKKITINKDSPLSLTGEASIIDGSRRAQFASPDLSPIAESELANLICDLLPTRTALETYYEGAPGISATNYPGYSYIQFRISGCLTVEDYKSWLTDHPLTVAYQSTEDTGRFYTGIEVKQGEDYHCAIVEINDRLHEGDTLETNVESACNKKVVIDGNTPLSLSGEGSIVGTSRRAVYLVDDLPLVGFTERGDVLCDLLPAKISQETYSTDMYGISVQHDDSSQGVGIRVPGCMTVEDYKAWLTDHPLTVWYKSTTAGDKNLRIKRTAFTKRTLVLDGTETYSSGQSGWASGAVYISNAIPSAVPAPDYSSIASIKCSHLKTVAPSAVTSGGSVGCAQGGKYNLYFFFGSEYASADAVKQYILAQYAAGTPVTIEYELAQPEVYADTHIEIENPSKSCSINSEQDTLIEVKLKSITDSSYLNGFTFTDIKNYIDDKTFEKGGVESFNGRKGEVRPFAGDYTAEMVSAVSNNPSLLTTEDLNNIKDYVGYYYARGGNSVTNVPSGFTGQGFGLFCQRVATSYLAQIFTASSYQFIRYFDGSEWNEWFKIYNSKYPPTAADVGALASDGTAVAANKLATARRIGNANFDGTANITLAQMGALSTTGPAASAKKLTTPVNIGLAVFDGSQSIDLNQIGALSKYARQLTDENLDDIKDEIGFYWASGGNTVANLPDGWTGYGFGLICSKIATKYYMQIIASSEIVYYRFYNGTTWYDWGKVYTEYQKPTAADVGLGKVVNKALNMSLSGTTLTITYA